MCLQNSSVRPWDSWNWSGDRIVPTPIVRASRSIPGRDKRYDIDIREFLTTTHNAVVNRALRRLVEDLPVDEQSFFRSHAPGSFDFRADKVAGFVGRLRYLSKANVTGRCPDAWLFPDETLAQGGGDCEDLAILLGALLMAAGISGYCVRVALGRLHISLPDEKIQEHDHCWVMYQDEAGVWEILEPLKAMATSPAKKAARRTAVLAPVTEYVPHYVFNADHLWLIDSSQTDATREFSKYCSNRRFWKKFDPGFAASVHADIFDKALGDLVSDTAISKMKRKSLWLDVNILTYDPRDHCDNGYVMEGWARANDHLAAFQKDNTDWASLGAAAHTIGDLYAHSSYMHFAALQNAAAGNGAAAPFQPGAGLVTSPAYTGAALDPSLAPFDLTSGQFSTNPNLWNDTRENGAAVWKGRVISGRYAQKYDPQATFWEGFTGIPAALTTAADFRSRGALPHHNEIAVDEQSMSNRHKLYRASSRGPDDRQAYANQFRWRVNTAIQHIRKAFLDNWQGAKKT
jgi:hypothetical protein